MKGLRAEAVLVWLLWTNPCFNAALDDSGNPTCQTGQDTLRDLYETRVYFWPTTGGPAARVLTQSAVGKACLPDSAAVDPGPGGHYWVTSADTIGNESCSSNIVYYGPVTAVEPTSSEARPVKVEFFDVFGRRVPIPRATGIYWARTTDTQGRVEKRRIVYLK